MADFHNTADGYAVVYTSTPVEQFTVTCPVAAPTSVTVHNADGTTTSVPARPACARVGMTDAPNPVTDTYKAEVAGRLKGAVATLRAEGCRDHGTYTAPAASSSVSTTVSTMTEAEKTALLA